MSTSPPTPRYSAVAKTLHWVIVAGILAQYVLATLFDDLPLGMHKLALLARHKSVGMTILMLAVLRLIWRLSHPPPPLPDGMSPWERVLAKATHHGFYVLLFAMPLSGWMMSSAKNYSVSWFGLFTWPNLVAPGEATFKAFQQIHEVLAVLLLIVTALHVAAALKHHFWNKDNVLLRMLPFARLRKEP